MEAWKSRAKELAGEKKQDFDDFNKRHGITRHKAGLADTPQGPMVVAAHEGPGADFFLQKPGESKNDFDFFFNEKLNKFHGMNMEGPPPGPMPERMIWNIKLQLYYHIHIILNYKEDKNGMPWAYEIPAEWKMK